MSLLDEARRLQGLPGTPCRLGALRDTNPELHAEIMAAIKAGVQMTALSRALAGRGINIKPYSLTSHLRGDCTRCRS
jgi:hypothetical protein